MTFTNSFFSKALVKFNCCKVTALGIKFSGQLSGTFHLSLLSKASTEDSSFGNQSDALRQTTLLRHYPQFVSTIEPCEKSQLQKSNIIFSIVQLPNGTISFFASHP